MDRGAADVDADHIGRRRMSCGRGRDVCHRMRRHRHFYLGGEGGWSVLENQIDRAPGLPQGSQAVRFGFRRRRARRLRMGAVALRGRIRLPQQRSERAQGGRPQRARGERQPPVARGDDQPPLRHQPGLAGDAACRRRRRRGQRHRQRPGQGLWPRLQRRRLAVRLPGDRRGALQCDAEHRARSRLSLSRHDRRDLPGARRARRSSTPAATTTIP